MMLGQKSFNQEDGAFRSDGISFLGQVEMPFNEWCKIPDHPHQRDTAKHAQRSKHLQSFSEIQRKMTLARLPNGAIFKVDGHTRAYMWQRGLTIGLPNPTTLMLKVDQWGVADEQALAKAYDTFDNRNAVDTVADEVFSAAKAAGIEFKSKLLRSGRYASAIKRVYILLTPDRPQEDYTLRDASTFFSKELKLLDSINPTAVDFTSGFTSGALFTLALDGTEAVDFWSRYQEGTGTKIGNQCDAIQALIHLRDYVRGNNMTGSTQADEEFRQCIAGYLAHKVDRQYRGKKAKPRPVSNEVIYELQAEILRKRHSRGRR